MYKFMLFLVTSLLLVLPTSAQTNDHESIVIDGAWIRATAEHGDTSTPAFPAAVYLTISNHGEQDEVLISASSPVATVIEIHQTTLEDDVMRMREIETIDIPAHGSVSFDAGGYHIMLVDLHEHLYAGYEVPVTLTFASGLSVDFVATVNDLAGDDAHTSHDAHASHGHDDGLTKLQFVAYVGDEVAQCGQEYDGIGADEATIHFNDFRLYISNIQLITTDGESVPFELEQDGIWQTANVALLDFEDKTAGCAEIGTPSYNGEIIGTAPEGDYTGISFDLGVPFELNHIDATSAPSPLNIAGLWWSWQGGYKFIRVDLVTDAAENNAWNLHVGSTGCVSPVSVVPPAENCARPNVATITFDEFDLVEDVIIADLGGLLAGVSLYDNTLMPPGCMAGVDDPDCETLFPGFGLSLETGECMDGDCSSQTFFRVGSREDVELIGRHTDHSYTPSHESSSGDHSGH